jgi:hypothetical protein
VSEYLRYVGVAYCLLAHSSLEPGSLFLGGDRLNFTPENARQGTEHCSSSAACRLTYTTMPNICGFGSCPIQARHTPQESLLNCILRRRLALASVFYQSASSYHATGSSTRSDREQGGLVCLYPPFARRGYVSKPARVRLGRVFVHSRPLASLTVERISLEQRCSGNAASHSNGADWT